MQPPDLACLSIDTINGGTLLSSKVDELFEAVGSMTLYSHRNEDVLPYFFVEGGGSELSTFITHIAGSPADLALVRQQVTHNIEDGPVAMYTIKTGSACGTGISKCTFPLSIDVSDASVKINEFFDGLYNGCVIGWF